MYYVVGFFLNLREQPLENPSICICFPSHDSSRNVEACPRGVSLRPMHLTVQDVKFWLLFGLLKPNCPQAFLTIKIYYMFLNRRFLACQIPSAIPSALELLQWNYRSTSSITSVAILARSFLWVFVVWGFFWVGLFWVCLYFCCYTWFSGICDSVRGLWDGWTSQAQCTVGFSIPRWCVPPPSHTDMAMVEPLQSLWSFSGCSWLSRSHELLWHSPLSCISFSPFLKFFPW